MLNGHRFAVSDKVCAALLSHQMQAMPTDVRNSAGSPRNVRTRGGVICQLARNFTHVGWVEETYRSICSMS